MSLQSWLFVNYDAEENKFSRKAWNNINIPKIPRSRLDWRPCSYRKTFNKQIIGPCLFEDKTVNRQDYLQRLKKLFLFNYTKKKT